MTTDTHEPDKVIKEADEKLSSSGLKGAQMVYQTALLEWVDDASFGASDPETVKYISEGVAKLWISFADLNRKSNMFKAATETFETAVNCPIAGSMGVVWKAYAVFQQDRKRNKTAQKVYLRALVGDGSNGMGAVTNQDEQDALWLDFLSMMKRLNNDDALTVEQLKAAVTSEHSSNATTVAQGKVKAEFVEQAALNNATAQIEQPSKRARLDLNEAVSAALIPKAPLISAAIVEATASDLFARIKEIPAEITAEWMAKDSDTLPSRPDSLFNPSPPRLSDPSGSDMLGTEISLKLIRLLIGGVDDNIIGSAILDVCQGCWTITALKEREATKCTEALDKKLTDDVRRMDADLEARLSVAGAALVAVQQINANERDAFITSCNHQRQHLQSLIAWEFRKVLATQQQILTSAGIPEFEGATTSSLSIYKQSKICSFLHSAFFLRNRIGEKAHIAMLRSQESKLPSQNPSSMPLPHGIAHDEVAPFVPQPQQFPPGAYPPMLSYGHAIQYH